MPVDLSLGFISYSISFFVYFIMLLIFFVGQREESESKPFLLLILISTLWAALLAFSQMGASLSFELIVFAELCRTFVWVFVLQFALGLYSNKSEILNFKYAFSPVNSFFILFISALLLYFSKEITLSAQFSSHIFLESLLQFIMPIFGLVMVEQLYRNTPKENRWNVQILCLSASAIFIFDIFVYSNAILWEHLNYDYWSARGFINILVLPLIVLAAVRNPTLAPRIYISRHVIFHSTALTASGIYLITISLAAYFVKEIAGGWGDLAQTVVIFFGLIVFILIFLSKTLRQKVKNYLAEHFFSNKYDYKEEWHRFSSTLLTEIDYSIYQRSLMAVCNIVESKGAALWLYEQNQLQYTINWNMSLSDEQKLLPLNLVQGFTNDTHVICNEHKQEKVLIDLIPNFWFALPLWNDGKLLGLAIYQKSVVERVLDSEDKELLKTVADHIGLYLSQHQVTDQLMEAQKFQQMSQATAFLVHDLKTVLSQLMLMSENAKVHKSNPEFINDMLGTIEHVSRKMQRLVQQLKSPETTELKENFDLIKSIETLIGGYSQSLIQFEFIKSEETVMVLANRLSFNSALKHIVQNSIEASDKEGLIKITLITLASHIEINIQDFGCGMSDEFVANKLFKAFESSKGVSGMGVGAYQSRQFFRSMGGDLKVQSKENEGSLFKINIPLI